jgi:hypothetical protein
MVLGSRAGHHKWVPKKHGYEEFFQKKNTQRKKTILYVVVPSKEAFYALDGAKHISFLT